MPKILSSEIISLVHHVKLHESGWWEDTFQNIIISSFGSNNNLPLSESELLNKIRHELNSDFDKSVVSKQLGVLKNKKIVIPSHKDFFVLSEDAFNNFKSLLLSQKEIESEAEKRFNDLCKKICPARNANILWKELNEVLIIPLIRDIGAKTYELISGEGKLSLEQYGQFVNYISRYGEDKINVKALILNYFDFKNDFVRKYVLHQLNAYFFIEATNLSQKTVDEVYQLSKSQTNLKIFVDTNFLLTLLDLHDNPSNDAALSLLELFEEIKNRIRIKFYVLPVTVYEFQNLIKKFKNHLIKLKPTLNQAIAAENTDGFSGIIKKYFQKCHELNSIINVDDYFDPYLDNFTISIRKKGLEIQQDNMEKYSTDQRVIDDLLEQVEYRYNRNLNAGKYEGLGEQEKEIKKQMIYDKFNHDCQLWYYVKDKRPAYIDSTKDIKNWIITLDFSFLSFDKYKQIKELDNKISLCLHPNEFISMLQFWVPRTQKFENAILGNFRLPFLFNEVDSESEKISLDILGAISQYEDSKSFSSEFIAETLTNKALRQKIKTSSSIEEMLPENKYAVFSENSDVALSENSDASFSENSDV